MNLEKIATISLDKKVAIQYASNIDKDNFSQDITKIKYLGGGSFGRAYGIDFANGEKIVIKFLIAEGMLEKEVSDLQLIAKHCPVSMPRVLFSHTADERIPFDCYAMSRIEGKSAFMSFDMLLKSKKKRLEFADKVTDALHQIHLCKSDRFGDAQAPKYESWLDFYKPFAKAILDKSEELYSLGRLPKKVVVAMRAAWEKFDIIFSQEVTEACLIHGDLNLSNIMVDKRRQISGFIDPLNCMYADKEFDLFQFDNLLGKRYNLRETYKRKFGASKYCDAKCAFYGLYHEVYCFIKTDMLIGFIMNPLVKNMNKRLSEL